MFTRPGTTKFSHGIHRIHRPSQQFSSNTHLKSYYVVSCRSYPFLYIYININIYIYIYIYLYHSLSISRNLYQSVIGSFFHISILCQVAFLDDWIEDPQEPSKAIGTAMAERWHFFHHDKHLVISASKTGKNHGQTMEKTMKHHQKPGN